MREIDERLKKIGLSWHWDKYRECLDLIYHFGEKNKIDPFSGQVGCISKLSKDDDDSKGWVVSIWNNCYDDENEKRIMIKGFGYYESSEASFELAKFKAQLVMMNWISIK